MKNMATTSDFLKGIKSSAALHTPGCQQEVWKTWKQGGEFQIRVGGPLDLGQLCPHMTGVYVPCYGGTAIQKMWRPEETL